jgi:UDP-N-acetylmuramate--alanine ligase
MVLPIYAAREENESGVSHTKLADALKKKDKDATALDMFSEVVSLVKQTVGEKDLVLVMGAGDITKVADALTK